MTLKCCGNPLCTTVSSGTMQVCAKCRARTYCVSLKLYVPFSFVEKLNICFNRVDLARKPIGGRIAIIVHPETA